MKQYKTISPDVTIANIRSILAKNDIATEVLCRSVAGSVFSTRVRLIGDGLDALNFGTNGKGVSPLYAMASGYAEFIERLQTDCLYGRPMVPSMRNYLLPGEEFKSLSEVRGLLSCYFKKSDVEKYIPSDMQIRVSPMRDLTTGKTYNVPIELLRIATGSTGCCAGNSAKEAILQGVCEIMERHSLQKLYANRNIHIGRIPEELFVNSASLSRLRKIARDYGLHYEIKNCSADDGFPVIGLLLWNKTHYKFKMGCATSPDIALDRCLAEIFQGCKGCETFNPLNFELMTASRQNYQNAKLDGTGHCPCSIFEDGATSDLSSFERFADKDVDGDFACIVQLLENKGYNVLVQDCSYLGFPSFYVYIPGLSDEYSELSDFPYAIVQSRYWSESIPMGWNLSERRPVVGQEDEYVHMSLPRYNIAYKTSRFPLDLLRTVAAIVNKDYHVAFKWFSRYLQSFKSQPSVYCKILREYLYMRHLNIVPKKAKEILLKAYCEDEAIVEELFTDDNVMMISLPTCFNCESCPTRSFCRENNIAKFDRKLMDLHAAWLENGASCL